MAPSSTPATHLRSSSILIISVLFGTVLPAQATASSGLEGARSALQQWVETRALISQENRDWLLQKEALGARSDIVKREIVALQRRTAEAEASIADADKKRRELEADNDKRKVVGATLEQKVAQLEERVLRILPRLPEPLRDRVKPLSQRLPAKGETTKLPLGDRYANVIGVLNEVHKWNREITVTSELRQVPDGQSVEVSVLYVGVGQAYYVGGGGKVAGIGTATPEAWVWRPANEWAPSIQQALAIFKNEKPAAFVQLPVQVQ